MISASFIKRISPYAVIALTVWLGWQVVREPVVERAPPALSLRLAPSSPTALQRGAELEFAANRIENAEVLARASLAGAPFNPRSLRVLGLAEARRGNTDLADQLVTLAGNWSLRDDAAHGWLVERRLRNGDYNSAFGHADTLIRRKDEIRPTIYRLFTTSALMDPRAVPAVVGRLAARPPWRDDYIAALKADPKNINLLATLVIALERTDAPFTDEELRLLYLDWLAKGQVPAVRFVRERLGRPAAPGLIRDSGFSDTGEVEPFAWMLGSGVGISTDISNDDLAPGNKALRVDYDGYSPGTAVTQLLLLTPGAYRFDGRIRQELGIDDPRMAWELICVEAGREASSGQEPVEQVGVAWRTFSFEMRVPAQQCTAQWLRLQVIPGNRRDQRVVWFDNLRATPVSLH